ncbi:MAG: alpha/beta hydrolase, partial [Bacteroidota bacterium]
MKKILLSCLAAMCLFPHLIAQSNCDAGRFLTEIFPQFSLTANIEYGENVQPTLLDPDARQTLFMDVYQPLGDTMSKRPLIIFAFGGGFVLGERDSPDIVELCERFARRGYVTASIDYRLTPELVFAPSEALAFRAVLKGTHDMRAAVRFFTKDAQTSNLFKIDPDQIIVGGVSAGGFAALHTAYLDKIEEIPDAIIADTATTGGLEGLSGNPAYSSEVIAVVNLSGALGDSSWLETGDQPVVHAHGTADAIVPYGSGPIGLFGGAGITSVDGSASIQIRADNIGVPSALLSFQGLGHVPFSSGPNNAAFMDSTIEFVANFLHPIISGRQRHDGCGGDACLHR